jgi:VanZ family protein
MAGLLWVWGPAVLQMALIFVASSLPGESLPSDLPDHTAHFVAYGLLGMLVLRAVAGARWAGVTLRGALLAWVICALYGVTDEWHQMYVSGRTPTLDDWVADALGAVTAVLMVVSIAALRRRAGRAI